MIKETIIVDITSIPEFITIEQLLYIHKKHKILFYNSSLGPKPYYVKTEVKENIRILDVNIKENQILLEEYMNKK